MNQGIHTIYHKQFEQKLLAFFILLLILITYCTHLPKEQNKISRYSLETDSSILAKSKERIDNTVTYEIHFDLLESTNCITVTIVATDSNKKRVRCAFIIEKLLDLPAFNKKINKPIYTEFGKNFDQNWRFNNSIIVCTDTRDPLKRLTKGTYRLRLSPFSDKFFSFTIDIESKVPIEFKQ